MCQLYYIIKISKLVYLAWNNSSTLCLPPVVNSIMKLSFTAFLWHKETLSDSAVSKDPVFFSGLGLSSACPRSHNNVNWWGGKNQHLEETRPGSLVIACFWTHAEVGVIKTIERGEDILMIMMQMRSSKVQNKCSLCRCLQPIHGIRASLFYQAS